MIIARAYTILDAVWVEVSCVHAEDPNASHLIIRELRRGHDGPGGQCRALREVLELADWGGLLEEPCG